MRKNSRYYNNGVTNLMVAEGEPVPEGFVPGMVRRSKTDVAKSNAKRKQTNLEKYGVELPQQSEQIRKKTKQTCVERYGVENVSQAVDVQEKRAQTFQEHFGSDNPMHSEDVKERLRQSCIEKYGVDNPFKSEDVKKKIRETNLENLGVEYPTQSQEVRDKVKQTNLEKFGVEAPLQSESIKEKAKQTSLERYGTEHPMQSAEVQERSKSTLFKHYGVDNPMHSKEILQTLRETNMALYGVPCSLQSDEVKEKIRQTCLERYGVDWACMRPEARAYSNDSGPNQYFASVLDALGISYEREYPIGKFSYDFKIGNILVEIDPYPTHNSLWSIFGEKGKEPDYHLKKSQEAERAGFRCIHVFDWDDIDKILCFFVPEDTVYARKCVVKKVSLEDCASLLRYHLQGSCKGQDIRLGLYCDDELVSLMTFGKPRYNGNYQYELLRYCSIKRVLGGAEKLFKHFIRTYHPESVISYCDRSKFLGSVYPRLGFELKSVGHPSKHWYGTKTKQHFTDNLVRQLGADKLLGTSYGKGTSNEEILVQYGFVPIYDCGQDSYIWKADN